MYYLFLHTVYLSFCFYFVGTMQTNVFPQIKAWITNRPASVAARTQAELQVQYTLAQLQMAPTALPCTVLPYTAMPYTTMQASAMQAPAMQVTAMPSMVVFICFFMCYTKSTGFCKCSF